MLFCVVTENGDTFLMFSFPFQSGETPLIKACLGEHVDVVKILLEEQAELEITDAEKKTALTAAVVKGSDEIVELLLERNIPANIHYTRVSNYAYYHLPNDYKSLQIVCYMYPSSTA